MKRIIKILILTLFITFTFNDQNVKEYNNLDRSDLINIRATSNIIKSTVRPIVKPIKTVIDYSFEDVHSATWYNAHGRLTASGERFHRDSLTAAYNNAKFGTYIKVTNIENNESIIVKVTDRMGNKSSNRIDLSLSAFDSISSPSKGRLNVKLEETKKPLD